jgi:hypothetical protein
VTIDPKEWPGVRLPDSQGRSLHDSILKFRIERRDVSIFDWGIEDAESFLSDHESHLFFACLDPAIEGESFVTFARVEEILELMRRGFNQVELEGFDMAVMPQDRSWCLWGNHDGELYFVSQPDRPEVWMRGPIPDIPPLLQPVAHALLQAVEEVRAVVGPLPTAHLWGRPGGAASVGFHVRHAAGSLDRLFIYARGEALSAEQRDLLAAEATPGSPPAEGTDLAAAFERQVDRALEQLRTTPDSTLLEARGVGRLQLPSTVLGLLFHAAEHTQRHVGQIVTTARIVRAGVGQGD